MIQSQSAERQTTGLRMLGALVLLVAMAPTALHDPGSGGQDSNASQPAGVSNQADVAPGVRGTVGQPASVSPPSAAAADGGEPLLYTVQPGDTLSGIAALFAMPLDDLITANQIQDPDSLRQGTELVIPFHERLSPPPGARSTNLTAVLRAAEREHHLPRGLLLALAWQESRWQQDAVSSAGAVGITQILPSTAEWIEAEIVGERLAWRTDAADNAHLGAAYLRYQLDRADGDVSVALAAYYQGWHGIQTAGVQPGTTRYVRSVLAFVPLFQ